jgi:hypothetical protein
MAPADQSQKTKLESGAPGKKSQIKIRKGHTPKAFRSAAQGCPTKEGYPGSASSKTRPEP